MKSCLRRKILETERCYLREVGPEDMPDRLRLFDSPHFLDFIPPINPLDEEIRYQTLYVVAAKQMNIAYKH